MRKTFYCPSSDHSVSIKPSLVILHVEENKDTLDELRHLEAKAVCNHPSITGEVLVKNASSAECTSGFIAFNVITVLLSSQANKVVQYVYLRLNLNGQLEMVIQIFYCQTAKVTDVY